MLLDLPNDVLLNIASYFSPNDLLVIRQTCRVLHAFACSDYVWHHLSIDIPLNTPPDSPISSLSGVVLQHMVISALRLDHNWRRRQPRVECSQITKDFKNATIIQLQLLGSRDVLILSRWPDYDELSAWRLHRSRDSQAYIGLKSIPMIHFAAATRSGDREATLVFLCNDEAVNVYSFSLDSACDRSYSLLKHIPAPAEGRTSVIEICNDVIATILAYFPESLGPPAYTIVFYNTVSNRRFLYHFSSKMSIDKPQVKLYPTCFVLIGVRMGSLVACIHGLPSVLHTQDLSAETVVLTTEQCPLLAQHVLGRVPQLCEFYISSEPVHECPIFSLILFYSFGEHMNGLADVYQVPMDTTRRAHHCFHSPSHRFKTVADARPEIVCIGKTGFRAVWLDHEWESDEYRLWKATFAPGEAALVSPLLPPHHPLPFEAHAIAALSFEEATGRICIGLRTGAVYILEF